MKNSNDTSWDRTSDIPICSTTPQPLCYRGLPFLTRVNGVCLTSYVSGPIWVNFATGDAHKNLLSGYRFRKNRRSDSLG